MKTFFGKHLIRLSVGLVILAGWSGWLTSYLKAYEWSRQVRELEFLNDLLIKDVGHFKAKYDTLIRNRLREGIRRLSSGGRSAEVPHAASASGIRETRVPQNKLAALSLAGNPQSSTEWTLTNGPEAVNLGTVSVSGQTSSSNPGISQTLEGRILSVDGEDEFVVINLGKKAGIAVGAEFLAKQQDSPAARLKVIEVRDFLAACDIEYLGTGRKLQTNDRVFLSGSQ